MPSTPHNLFASIGLAISGRCRWRETVRCESAGLYAISVCDDARRNARLMTKAPIDLELVRQWLGRVPTFTLDKRPDPPAEQVASCLANFWLPDESIVYLGKASCLKDRLDSFRRHRLGDRKPHAGGHWLKTLANLDDLTIFFCEVESAAAAAPMEDRALAAFVGGVSAATRRKLPNPALPIPFANREHPRGNRKQCRIRRDVLR